MPQTPVVNVTRLLGAASNDDAQAGVKVGSVHELHLQRGPNSNNNNVDNNHNPNPNHSNGVMIVLGPNYKPLLYNSIVVLPNIITAEECAQLRDAHTAVFVNKETHDEHYNPYHPRIENFPSRISIEAMAPHAWDLSEIIIKQRMLPRLQKELPGVAETMFGLDGTLFNLGNVDSCTFKFSAEEPRIILYEDGELFQPHQDGFAITINILLSEEGAFTEAGTAFYTEGSAALPIRTSEKVRKMHSNRRQAFHKSAPLSAPFTPIDDLSFTDEPTIAIHPQQGAGVVWNGNVWHEALPVKSGKRHVYVASFKLRCNSGISHSIQSSDYDLFDKLDDDDEDDGDT